MQAQVATVPSSAKTILSAKSSNEGEWRIAIGKWFFLEGSAPALPKIFFGHNNRTSHSNLAYQKNFLSEGWTPARPFEEFSRHGRSRALRIFAE